MSCVQHWLGKVCIEYDACSTGWEKDNVVHVALVDFVLNVMRVALVGWPLCWNVVRVALVGWPLC